jgi:xylan 1,4-beta-xylosidase
VDLRQLGAGNAAGFFAFGNKENALGLTVRDGMASVVRRERNKTDILKSADLPKTAKVYLRMAATDGHRFRFSIWNETKWTDVGGDMDLEGDYLPPWDRGVRVAVTVGGQNPTAKFEWLKVINAN